MTVESIIGITAGLIAIGGFVISVYNRIKKQLFVCSECHLPFEEVQNGGDSLNKKRKRIVLIAAAVVVIGGGIFYFGLRDKSEEETMPIIKSINKYELAMKVGASDTLQVKCQPVDAQVAVRYSSDNEKVAKVTSDGVVSAVGKGNATVRVTAQLSDDKIDTFWVKVNVSYADDAIEKSTGTGWGNYKLSWGNYNGPRELGKAGEPHGVGGTIEVNTSYSIDLKDGRGSTLQVYPGETIVNTKFVNGHLRQGELHRNDGTRKWFNI